jgi:branched-chain amino acid transport system substrate-binding protein
MRFIRRGRRAVSLALVLCLLAAVSCGDDDADTATNGGNGAASGEEVHIAVVVPTSGTYAQSGTLVLRGAEMAADEINENGGIEALDGARVVLDVQDAGESVESAVSAATRALSGDKPAGGIGSWLSSFTLGVTEVAERQRVPWVTLSYADSITDRGFEFVYQTSVISGELAGSGLNAFIELAAAQDLEIETIALVGDNTAASVFIFDPIRDRVAGEMGLEIVADEVWTPPLTDAAPISERLRSAQPDLIVFGATNFNDATLILESNEQFGVTAPYMAGGSWLILPDYIEGLGEERIEGLVSFVGHPMPLDLELNDRFVERTGEPFMTPDSVAGYYHVWLLKEAIEAAGSADPEDVNAALKELDLTEGPAAENMVTQRVRFDEVGRRMDAAPVLVQWQDAVPVVIFPPDIAPAQARELRRGGS